MTPGVLEDPLPGHAFPAVTGPGGSMTVSADPTVLAARPEEGGDLIAAWEVTRREPPGGAVRLPPGPDPSPQKGRAG